MTPLGQGLTSPTDMLFNHPIRGIMSIINRPPIGIDNDGEHHEAVTKRQTKNDKDKDTSKNFVSIPIGSTVAVQWEDGGPWTQGTIEGKGDIMTDHTIFTSQNRQTSYTIQTTQNQHRYQLNSISGTNYRNTPRQTH